MFVDADDWLEDGCIDCLLQTAERTDADFVLCDWHEYKKKGTQEICESMHFEKFIGRDINYHSVLTHFLRSRAGGAPWGKLFKNSIIKDHEVRFINNLPYAEDYLFVLSYLRHASTAVNVSRCLYGYNCMQEGARAKFRKNAVDILLQVEDEKYRLYGEETDMYDYELQSELVEQVASCIWNLRNHGFSWKEKRTEFNKAGKYLKRRGMSIGKLLNNDAGIKQKVLCCTARLAAM